MSNKYQFVNVRFNLNKPEEKALYEKLDNANRGGNIKKVLKNFFLLSDEDLIKKADLKSLIEEVVGTQLDIREERKIVPLVNKNKKIKIITQSGD